MRKHLWDRKTVNDLEIFNSLEIVNDHENFFKTKWDDEDDKGDKKGKITGNHFDSTASPQCLHSVTAVSPQWHRGDGKSVLSITLAPVKRFASLYNVCI